MTERSLIEKLRDPTQDEHDCRHIYLEAADRIKYRLAVSIFKAQLRPDQVNLAVASTREGEQQ